VAPKRAGWCAEEVEIKNAIRHGKVLASGTKKISARGVQGSTGLPNVNLGPPLKFRKLLELQC